MYGNSQVVADRSLIIGPAFAGLYRADVIPFDGFANRVELMSLICELHLPPSRNEMMRRMSCALLLWTGILTIPAAGPAHAGDAAPNEVTAQAANWDEVQQWVDGQKGNVVVIDVWSTFCLPCVREFPHFVEFHNSHAGKVACASLNIDYYGSADTAPDQTKPKITKFLTSKNATMKNFISSDADEKILTQIDTSAIPAALVYDQNGKLVKVFNNDNDDYGPDGFNYEKNIIPFVESLLK